MLEQMMGSFLSWTSEGWRNSQSVSLLATAGARWKACVSRCDLLFSEELTAYFRA